MCYSTVLDWHDDEEQVQVRDRRDPGKCSFWTDIDGQMESIRDV